MTSDPAAPPPRAVLHLAVGWRSALRRELGLLFALKMTALLLLWWLFFSPQHRTAVDAVATGHRLGIERAAADTAEPAGRAAEATRP